MKTLVPSGRGVLVRLLAALFILGATVGQARPGAAGAAQADADAEIADIHAMTLTPDDLEDEGLDGYGVSFGQTTFPDEMIAFTAEGRGLDEDEVADLFEDASFLRRYDSYLALPDEDDPSGPVQRQIISYVLEFADEDGAAEAFAFLEDESDNPAAEDVRAAEVGDESEATREEGEDPATGDEFAQIDLAFRVGNIHAGVAIVDWLGEEPDTDEAEALAERLLERIEETLDAGDPGLGSQVARLTGDTVVTSADYYLLQDGDVLAAAGESRADVRGRRRAAADIGQTDSYRLWQQLFAGEDDPADDVWYQVEIARFDDEDAASEWLAGTEDRIAGNQAFTNLEIDDSAATVGDESIVYSVETEDGATYFHSVTLRVDAALAIIDVSGPEPLPAAAIEALGEAQADCLDDGACPEPLALPDELDEYIADLGAGSQTDDDEDATAEAVSTPVADDDAGASGDVPMFRNDPARTGVLTTAGPEGEPELRWSLDTGSDADSTAAVVDGVLYVGSSSGNLFALDAETGEEIWTFSTEGQPIQSSPTVADGVVYIGSYDGSLYAIETETGDEVWSFATDDMVRSSPAVVDGAVYVGSADGGIYAVEAESGDELWSVETGGEVYSSPAVVDGIVYVGSTDGNLYALETETGDEVWTVETSGTIWSSPAVVDGVVFFGIGLEEDSTGAMLAVDAENGDELWRFETGSRVWSSPAVDGGIVYAGSNDGNLYALDAETGEEVWALDVNVGSSSPVVADGVVYIGGGDFLHAVDAESGEELWTFEVDDSIASSPTVAGGLVYVGSGDDTFYAVGSAEE